MILSFILCTFSLFFLIVAHCSRITTHGSHSCFIVTFVLVLSFLDYYVRVLFITHVTLPIHHPNRCRFSFANCQTCIYLMYSRPHPTYSTYLRRPATSTGSQPTHRSHRYLYELNKNKSLLASQNRSVAWSPESLWTGAISKNVG